MKYYQTQLDRQQAQDLIIREFNKALAQFPKVEIIPVRIEAWEHNSFVQMAQLFRTNNEYYLVGLYTESIKQYETAGATKLDLFSRRIKVQHIKSLELPNILTGKLFISPSTEKEIVYEGEKLYCCFSPEALRQQKTDYFDDRAWYFTDFATPDQIIEKISERMKNNVAQDPIVTIHLKRSPFKGFKKNVVYRRYNKFRWTLTNKNGREADEYELTV